MVGGSLYRVGMCPEGKDTIIILYGGASSEGGGGVASCTLCSFSVLFSTVLFVAFQEDQNRWMGQITDVGL